MLIMISWTLWANGMAVLLHVKVKFSSIENYFSLKLHCVDLANVIDNHGSGYLGMAR